MKFSSSFLPAALSLFSLSLASIIEDRGYDLRTEKGVYGVFSPYYHSGAFCVDIIRIDPIEKAVSIYFDKNDEEHDHKYKLSLQEIYTALCKKKQADPNDVNWLSFDVNDDSKTDNLIDRIRSGRGLGPRHEVKLVPSDEEWDWIFGTQYYQKMEHLTDKQVHSIIIRHHYDESPLGTRIPINRIGFSFVPLEDVDPDAEAGIPFDDEEQRAAIKALFGEK